MKSLRASALLAVIVTVSLLLSGCSSVHPNKPKASTKRSLGITSIQPSSGTTFGGTPVTILGIGFNATTRVTFGTEPASNIIVASNTKIVATSPAQKAGTYNIVVSTARGASPKVVVDRFTYVIPPPVVAMITPMSGTTAGGTTVTITGTSFLGATQVNFGAKVAALSFKVISDTEIVAVSPPQVGARYVIVTTPYGTSVTAPANQFSYKIPPPTVSAITPNSGPTAGGTVVTITGTGFLGAKSVLFGTVSTTRFAVVSNTEITATAPAQGPGTRYVGIITPGGRNADANGIDQFTFRAPVPVVTSLSPGNGPATGGTVVAITGSGFTRATKVLFGSVPATTFTVVSDTRINATAPPQAPGTRFVRVVTSGGISPANPTSDQFVDQ
jgi:hypothetical protein